jgi:glucose-6-phosphate 1-epimerase
LPDLSIASQLSTDEQYIIASCPAVQATSAAEIYPQHSFDANEPLPLLAIDNGACRAILALQGAHVLSFIPRGQSDLVWLSPQAQLCSGKAIRGGIPVCLPWFGVNQRDPQKPKHGFARTSRWTLEQASTDANGITQLQLGLRKFAQSPHELFAYCFSAQLNITFAEQLTLALQVDNCSGESMPLSWALHSYHPVSNLDNTSISGLKDTDYLDNTRALHRFTQRGDPIFRGEFDRAYMQAGSEQTINGNPAIRINAVNAPSAIVWNPGDRNSHDMADLGANQFREFICLERGAAFDDELLLAPNSSMQASVTIALVGNQGA